ncbi:MAG: flagellar biosynthesis protein [Selenomonas sp.]|nr:flagellar biosynthesis protein [Selenomonas sp.]
MFKRCDKYYINDNIYQYKIFKFLSNINDIEYVIRICYKICYKHKGVYNNMETVTKIPNTAGHGRAIVGKGQGKSAREGSFANELKAAGEVKFSAHAEKRMNLRGIQFSSEDKSQLRNTVDRMAEKGLRDALILMKKTALVVSIENRTVITAVDEDSAKENIFTNIDSVAIL